MEGRGPKEGTTEGKELKEVERDKLALSSGQVRKQGAFLYDGLGKLLKHTVHVSALSRPKALQEANVAPVTCDEKGHVGVLLRGFHWNGMGG